MNDKTLKQIIQEELGMAKKPLRESYVTQAKKYSLTTELLSDKNKQEHQKLLEKYVEALNTVSAKLDTVDKDDANPNYCDFRNLKIDEVYNMNAARS